jgi:hypothetical protein
MRATSFATREIAVNKMVDNLTGNGRKKNSKLEIRMANQIRMTKTPNELLIDLSICFVIRISDLIRHSSFGFRISW